MKDQISFWDYGTTPLKIDKPLRLIELFAGIGAQAKAFENLGVPFEHWRVCEIDKYAVRSYNAVHGTDFETSDICKLHGADMGVVDTDKYCYVLTYSFPCQDLSNAGKKRGMAKGEGTRSGLLWEVERLLLEMDERPQILLMENVPEVCRQENKEHFREWIMSLINMGYTNEYAILNATDYGMPQNRERCYMVSWLGEHTYRFPDKRPLERKLSDMLEDEVDEKYYLSPEQVQSMFESTFDHNIKYLDPNGIDPSRERERACPTLGARDYKGAKTMFVGVHADKRKISERGETRMFENPGLFSKRER